MNGAKGTGTICANCQTTSTPLWRKDRPSGAVSIQVQPLQLASFCALTFPTTSSVASHGYTLLRTAGSVSRHASVWIITSCGTFKVQRYVGVQG